LERYDVFISYSEANEAWVETELLPRLDARGLTYIDQVEFLAGKPRLLEMQRALSQSRYTVLIFGQDYLENRWKQFEGMLVTSKSISEGTWQGIPVKVEACELPDWVTELVAVDLATGGERNWKQLLDRLESTATMPSPVTWQAPRLPKKKTRARWTIFIAVLIAILGLVFRPTSPDCPGEISGTHQGVLSLLSLPGVAGPVLWAGLSGEGLVVDDGSHVNRYHAPELGAETVLSLMASANGQEVWAGTSGGGVTRITFSGEQPTFHTFTLADGLPGCKIRALAQRENKVLAGTLDGKHLGLWTGEQWEIIPPPPDWEDGIIFIINSLQNDPGKGLWVGTVRGLYRFEDSGWSGPFELPWETHKYATIEALALDSHGFLWVGTENGLAVLETEGLAQTWYGPFTGLSGLASEHTTSLASSGENQTMWVGTTKGLSICQFQQDAASAVSCVTLDNEDLAGKRVHSLAFSPAGDVLYIGTNQRTPLQLEETSWLFYQPSLKSRRRLPSRQAVTSYGPSCYSFLQPWCGQQWAKSTSSV